MKERKNLENPEILYEDMDLLVLNKPSGWITNSSSTTTNQPVLQDWLKKEFNYSISKSEEMRSGIVHRLDKETSGCLIIAKNELSFYFLQGEFKKREITKHYLALVHGEVKEEKGNIVASVGRLPWRRDRFGILAGGRDAETGYRVIEKFDKDNEKLTLLELFPKTGRTHQIRIHLKYINHPIVSDEFYAGRKTARKDRKWCPRLFLHSNFISFTHPTSKKKIEVKAPLPFDLESVKKSL